MIAWLPFVNPMPLSSSTVLWLLIPLCLSVAIIYKAIRIRHLHRLWLEVLRLMGYMMAGLVGLGVSLWGIHRYWP